jgi:NitT/TauT family transport system substrate-binding protein
MSQTQTRRRVLAGFSRIGAAALMSAPTLAAERSPETTSVRLPKTESICVAPQDVVADLLRAEGFTDIRYVPLPPGTNTPDAIAQGKLDFGTTTLHCRSPG